MEVKKICDSFESMEKPITCLKVKHVRNKCITCLNDILLQRYPNNTGYLEEYRKIIAFKKNQTKTKHLPEFVSQCIVHSLVGLSKLMKIPSQYIRGLVICTIIDGLEDRLKDLQTHYDIIISSQQQQQYECDKTLMQYTKKSFDTFKEIINRHNLNQPVSLADVRDALLMLLMDIDDYEYNCLSPDTRKIMMNRKREFLQVFRDKITRKIKSEFFRTSQLVQSEINNHNHNHENNHEKNNDNHNELTCQNNQDMKNGIETEIEIKSNAKINTNANVNDKRILDDYGPIASYWNMLIQTNKNHILLQEIAFYMKNTFMLIM